MKLESKKIYDKFPSQKKDEHSEMKIAKIHGKWTRICTIIIE